MGKFISENKTTIVFFCVTFLCSIFTVCAFLRCHSHFVESQDKIVANQTVQTTKIDSLLSSFRESVKTHSNDKEQIVRQIISDSIIVKLPKLSTAQQKTVRQYLEATLVASTNEISYAVLLKDLEATLATKQLSQIQDDTKSLLELEFNKIQHEYEALALWGGILTIVFLIFSFYSLFKTDQLAQQGQSALDKITSISEKAETKVGAINDKAEEKLSKIEETGHQLLLRTEQKLTNNRKEIDALVKKTINETTSEVDKFRLNATLEIKGLKDESDSALKETQGKLLALEESFENNLNDKIKVKFEEVERTLKGYIERWEALIRDMEDLTSTHKGVDETEINESSQLPK